MTQPNLGGTNLTLTYQEYQKKEVTRTNRKVSWHGFGELRPSESARPNTDRVRTGKNLVSSQLTETAFGLTSTPRRYVTAFLALVFLNLHTQSSAATLTFPVAMPSGTLFVRRRRDPGILTSYVRLNY